jgi:Glycosyltransferase family 87
MQNLRIMFGHTTAQPFFLRKSTVFFIFFITLAAINIAASFTTHMNVYDIFRYSYYHLIQHKDLYVFYPQEYFDQYQYSPSFPVMFAPFAALPYFVGYYLWNNLSMLLVPFFIFKIKGLEENTKAIVCYIALIEMLTCLQGTQTNVMIGALMLLAFISFENENYWIAAFAIAAGFYIKIYPIITASLFILYPNKIKFLAKFVLAMLLIGALPLFIISPSELVSQYHSWYSELVVDQRDNSGKISLTGFFQIVFHLSDFGKLVVQIFGVAIFCLMFKRKRLFDAYFYRLYFLCVMLIWVALFNHASEIYGYAISILGVGLWYATKPASKKLNIFICLFLFFATILSIDPTPRFISVYIYEHALKPIPYALMMCFLIWEMLTKDKAFFLIKKTRASLKIVGENVKVIKERKYFGQGEMFSN